MIKMMMIKMMMMKSKNKTHKNIIQQKQVNASNRKSEPPMEPPIMAPKFKPDEEGTSGMLLIGRQERPSDETVPVHERQVDEALSK